MDWITVRKVLLMAKPDWQPISVGENGIRRPDDDANAAAYEFCEKVMRAYDDHNMVACSGCKQKKSPHGFFRCWDCEAYLCRECIRGHGVSNIPHPKLIKQFEDEIAALKKRIEQYVARDDARDDHDSLWN